MHYQIYIPLKHTNGKILLKDQLAAVGLSDLVDGSACVGVDDGPDGTGGILIGWPKPRANRMSYNATGQEWEPSQPDGDLEAGRYWVGYWNDSPVIQSDLLRSRIVRGVSVELGNGERWHAPNLDDLPADAVLKNGEWIMMVQPEFSRIFVEGIEWKRAIAENSEFEWSDAVDFVMSNYQINYRLTREVASKLGLFNKISIVKSLFGIQGIDAEAQEANS